MNTMSSNDRVCVITLSVNGPVPADHPRPLFQDRWRSNRLFVEYFKNDRAYVRRLLADPEDCS